MARILLLGTPSPERDGLAWLIELAGHRCQTADSFPEASNLLQREACDLVLADSPPGGENPQQVVQALKNISAGTTVLVLTAEAGDPDEGSDEVITLPYSPVQHLSTRFSPIQKKDAFVVLLPEQESLKHLDELPQTPAMLSKLAVLYHFQEKYTAAEQLYKRALDAGEKTLGPQHREVASILYNLANLYQERKKYVEAEPLYKRSLEIVEKAFGANHPKVARRLRSLADLYRAQGRNDKAASLDQRLESMEKTP